jgi:Putative Ig domain
MNFARGMRWAATAALTTAFALAAATGASAASSGPVWGPPVAYTSTGIAFLSISCVSVGDCVAVGETEFEGSEAQPVVAAESGGTWGTTAIVTGLPSGGSTTPDAVLDSVSCTGATSCVAVGDYKNSSEGTDPMVVPVAVSGSDAIPGAASTVTLPSEDASASAQTSTLDGVSCASAGSCTAVGYYKDASEDVVPMTAVASGGAAWTASEVTTYPTAPSSETVALTAISCPSSGACEAVGNYDSAKDLYPWAVEVSNGQAGAGRSVTLPANFVAIEVSAIPSEGLGTIGLATISCPSAGACTAAGSYTAASGTLAAVAVPIANGAPGAPTELSGVVGDNFIAGIWCSDASDCALAGSSLTTSPTMTYNGIVASESAGGWSALAKLPNEGEAIQLVTTMTCATAGRCVASGITDTGAGLATFFANSVPALSLATSSLPAATVGQPYSATLQAEGGTGAYGWSTSNGLLPAGLSLNAATGVISGTPTTAGESGFTAGVTDAGPPSQTASIGLSIDVAPAAPPPPPAAVVSVAYVKTHGAKATVVLTCSGAPCAGRLKIIGVEHLKGAKATAVIAKAHKKSGKKASKKTITLASGSYAIAVGGKQVVTLTFSGAASKLLAGLHSMSGELEVTPLGATSPAVVKKLKFKSTKAKKHKKKKRKK